MINRIKQVYGVKAQNNKSKLARDLGMNTRTVTQYVEGETKPSVDFLVNILSAYPDISAEWLMRGKGEMLTVETPQEINHDYAHICKQMADMYAEIQKLQTENAALKAKRGEAVA